MPRPSLIEQLNKGLDGKLTLISAPAGFGKTTVVAEWLSQTDRPTAWVSLDEEDSQPSQFFGCVAAALRPFLNRSDHLATLLEAPAPPDPKVWAVACLNDLATLSEPTRLVLDDYHAVESVEVDTAMTFVLEHLPPQMHVVITTREDPPFPLPRFRVRGQLNELRAADLRFTVEDTAVFLNQMMGLSLTPEDIAILETRTEGWIAGLQLAALSMQDRTDTAAFIQAFTGTHHFVLDYLIEEVLQRQTDEVRQFLLQTAILDRFTSSLCDAVTERSDGLAMMTLLEQENLFVVRLDDERRWYRYHHLFAEMLRTRLAQGWPELLPQLHQRASDWHAEHGQSADAVRHALMAKDFERAARHIELARDQMDLTNHSDPWRQWVEALPDSVVRLRPVLIVGYAWAHLIFDSELDACERRLQEAEAWLNRSETERESLGMVVEDEEKFKMLPASIASARTYAARAAGDLAGAVNHARRALDLLPEHDDLGRALPLSLLGLSYFANGELSSAYEALNDSFAGFRKGGNILAAISIQLVMADVQMAQGRLRDAKKTCQQALQLASTQGDLNVRGTANLLLSLSEIHREQGDSDTADDYLEQIDALGKEASSPNYQYHKRVALASVKANQGAFEEAHATLEDAAPWLGQVHLRETQSLGAIKAQVWLKQGRPDEALAWAQKHGLSVDDELSFLHEFDYLTLARLRIAQVREGGNEDAIHQAVQLLERLSQRAEDEERAGSLIKISVLQALAQEAQNKVSMALTPLTQALTLAQPEGYVRVFVDEGSPMLKLLQAAVQRGISAEYVNKLLAAFGEPAEAPSSRQPLADPLSERELEVLKLLATSLSGPEIARELMVSVNTMRTHTKNIYSKLGVNTRQSAVHRAAELQLL